MVLTWKQLLYSMVSLMLMVNLSAYADPAGPPYPAKGHNPPHSQATTPHSHAPAVSSTPARNSHPAFAPNRKFETHFSQQNQIQKRNNFNYHNRTYAQPALVYPNTYVTTYVADPVVDDVNQDGYVVHTNSPSSETAESNEVNQDEYEVVNSNSATGQSWVAAENGNVPNGAIPYSDENGAPEDTASNNASFYCRAQYNNQSFDGVLVAGEGCYVEDRINAATIRLENYQVLVNN